ncbi:hypothetical protein D3C87_41180 [compost metagenome]
MNFTFFLIFLSLPLFPFAQNFEGPTEHMRKLKPFKENGEVVDCRRDWMMPKERMDSLKLDVKRLDEKLAVMTETTVDLISVSFVQLFESEYEVRLEAWGEINEHFCVSDNDAGKKFRVFDSGEADFSQMQFYGEDYLVITEQYYYLGNCQKLTTVKSYYIRRDYPGIEPH